MAGNYQSSAKYLGILFLTFWILLSYLVPISLFVTMEIVKFALVRSPSPARATRLRCPQPATSICDSGSWTELFAFQWLCPA